MIEKKKILLLMNFHVLYMLELQTSKKNYACLSVYVNVCTYVR